MSRYIDGDALFSEVTTNYRYTTGEARIAYRNVLDMICNADNKDAEEVRHGYWVQPHPSNKPFCSECKTFEQTGEKKKYCSECGAKMDKEEEE